jgi:hypothetical protein
MNKIDHKELFGHLSDFFKSKGIELREGPYTQGIQKGCELLADTVNLSHQAFELGKEQMEKHLEQMRQIVHERTAPKPPPRQPQSASSPAQGKTKRGKPSGQKSAPAKSSASKRKGRK